MLFRSVATLFNLPLNKVATSLMNPNLNVTTTSLGNPPVGYAFLTTDPYQKYHQTSVLTVWRTLWVELDQMKLNNSSVLAGIPLIDDFVATELARACIDIKPYSPNTTTWVSGPETLVYNWNSGPKSLASACRNLPQPSNTFWTVHMIGAFKGSPENPNSNPPMGMWYENTNTIFIFHEQIRLDVQEWNDNYQQTYPVSLIDFNRLNSLHEIGHALGLDDYPSAGGVMDVNLDYYDSLLPVNKQFRFVDIQIIQSQPLPR